MPGAGPFLIPLVGLGALVPCGFHSCADVLWDEHARDFIMEEFRVAPVTERKDANQLQVSLMPHRIETTGSGAEERLVCSLRVFTVTVCLVEATGSLVTRSTFSPAASAASRVTCSARAPKHAGAPMTQLEESTPQNYRMAR